MKENVILVDHNDNEVGIMEKMQAHIQGKLHRAFSIFMFNRKGELLLQQRSADKYHSGGKWTNTCCGHPRPGERTLEAAHRRLKEEMGLSCPLFYGFNFIYCATIQQEIIENEFDHVFFGFSDSLPNPVPKEVEGFKYMSLDLLGKELRDHQSNYTKWLKICFEEVVDHYLKLSKSQIQ